MDCSLPDSSVHRISQARILEWVVISFHRGPSQLKDWTQISCTDKHILYHWVTREAPTYRRSVQFSCSVVSASLQPHGLQYARPPCPSPTPGVYSNSCPLSRWGHPTILSSVIPFSSCLQSFPVSGSFPMSQLFTSGGQSIGTSVSASVLPTNIQEWFSLGWTGWFSLQAKGLSRVFSNTTVKKYQLLGAQLSFHSRTLAWKIP